MDKMLKDKIKRRSKRAFALGPECDMHRITDVTATSLVYRTKGGQNVTVRRDKLGRIYVPVLPTS